MSYENDILFDKFADWNFLMTLMSAVVIVVIAAFLAFILSAIQSHINANTGSDHAVHSFLIRALKKNGNRLFVRIPNLTNRAYTGALPLYLHSIFVHFRPNVMRSAEKFLNPCVNGIHVLMVGATAAFVVTQSDLDIEYVIFTGLIFALTPQFYHALSARNFGLSARSIGLGFLTVFYIGAYCAETRSGVSFWLVVILAGYLIWAFSTFAMQVLVIISALLFLVTGHWISLAGTAGGLLLFIAIHPRYSLGYLKHTLKFINSYAQELAPIYVLGRRHSIWRDLVYDIWLKMRSQPLQGLRYAYENSVIIVVFLNPIFLVSLYVKLSGWPEPGSLLAFSADLAFCGAIAMILTSVRPTRFLGEPERYVEAITPWATIVGTAFLIMVWGKVAALLAVLLFLIATISQLLASYWLSRHLNKQSLDLSDAENAIISSGIQSIRCCSNNEHITKLLMHNDWQFSYCIAVGNGYCGMSIMEAFSSFPKLHRDACAKIISAYEINICVLDRKLYDNVFDAMPENLISTDVIFESADLRVLNFMWRNSQSDAHIPVNGPQTSFTWN